MAKGIADSSGSDTMVAVDEKGIAKLKESFVDREKELEELKRYLTDANDSVGRLVFIAGEAGVGKTALINELGKQAVSKEMRFLKGRCLYQENSDPYLPFIDALRQYFSSRIPEDARQSKADGLEQDETLPLSFIPIGGSESEDGTSASEDSGGDFLPIGLLPIATPKESTQPAPQGQPIERKDILAERDRMFDTISQLIINISNEKPLLLFIDDLQWADTASLQLLHYLARRIAKSRVMICCAYRPEELEDIEGRPHPLKNALQRINSEKLAIHITLQRLDYDAVSLMVRRMIEVDEIPDSFLKLLHEESEGNPLFIEEVLKSLIEEGVINAHSYVWDFEIDIAKIRMPDTIKDIIARRLSKLSEDAKKVVMYCSIIGHTFTFELLFKVSELKEEQLLDAIDELIVAKLIKEEPSSKEEIYSFDQVQVRSVIYSTLSKSRARVMHKKVGEIFEELYKKNLDEIIFSLAHHFTLGKDFKKAQVYSEKAGDKSARLFAMDDAVKYYEWTLTALDESEESYENTKKKIELLTKLGDLSNVISSWQSALDYYNRLAKLCEGIGEKIKTAEAYRKIADTLRQMRQFEESTMAYEQGLKISESIKDLKGIAESHRGLGYIDWRRGENDSAIAHYNISIKNSMFAGDIHTIARTFIDLGNVYNYRGDLNKATEFYHKGLDELKKLGDINEIARAYINLGDVAVKQKDLDGAISYLEKAKEYGEKIGSRFTIAWSYFNAGEAYARKGELKKAKDNLDRSLRIMERLGDSVGLLGIYRNYGMIYRLEKKWDESLQAFKNALTYLQGRDLPFEKGEVYLEMGILYKDMDNTKEALEHLRTAERIYSDMGSTQKLADVRRELELMGQCQKGDGKG